MEHWLCLWSRSQPLPVGSRLHPLPWFVHSRHSQAWRKSGQKQSRGGGYGGRCSLPAQPAVFMVVLVLWAGVACVSRQS